MLGLGRAGSGNSTRALSGGARAPPMDGARPPLTMLYGEAAGILLEKTSTEPTSGPRGSAKLARARTIFYIKELRPRAAHGRRVLWPPRRRADPHHAAAWLHIAALAVHTARAHTSCRPLGTRRLPAWEIYHENGEFAAEARP